MSQLWQSKNWTGHEWSDSIGDTIGNCTDLNMICVPHYSEWKSFGDNSRQLQPRTHEIQKDLQFYIVSNQECELQVLED